MRYKQVAALLITGSLAFQLLGCSAASQSELLSRINQGDQIEIEVAAPAFAESEQGTQSTLSWVELGLLDTNPTMRKDWDDILQIKGSSETKWYRTYWRMKV